jgi:hypothetical protein
MKIIMKQYFFIFTILVIPFFSNAQDGADSKIVFDNTTFNFGVLERGSKAECEFSFINKSLSPVAISKVKASCGCTAPTWSKEPVKPNGSGKIKVKYNTNITGSFVKTITIYTTLDNETITLTIQGEVKKKPK